MTIPRKAAHDALSTAIELVDSMIGRGLDENSPDYITGTRRATLAVISVFGDEDYAAEMRKELKPAPGFVVDPDGRYAREDADLCLRRTASVLRAYLAEVDAWPPDPPSLHDRGQMAGHLREFQQELGQIYLDFENNHNGSEARHRMSRVFDRLHDYLHDAVNPVEAAKVYASVHGRVYTDHRAAVAYPYHDVLALIQSLVQEVEGHGLDHLRQRPSARASAPTGSPLDTTLTLCRRFHRFARELGRRRSNKTPYTFEDEYDVQDAMRGLLKLHFDDVRPEEWTPSYGGGSAKMDFLLKAERIVIETKMTRESLRDAKVGAELIVDIERYNQHPHCGTLVCFVYDPSALLLNPDGLVADLSGGRDGLTVQVVVAPGP